MDMLGVIGGTGLDRWGGLEHELRGETPYGSASGPIAVYEVGDTDLLFIGRHGLNHSIPPHRVNYRANLFALHQAGVRQVIGVNAVGGVTERYGPGRLVLPDQLIDYTWGRMQSFSEGDDERFGLQHVEFARPFEGPLRHRLLAGAAEIGLDIIDGGCIGVVQGPRLETGAEIRRLRRDGCDLVGMTAMPEASLARELKMDYTSICVVANEAADETAEPITMEAIERNLAEAIGQARALIEHLCLQP